MKIAKLLLLTILIVSLGLVFFSCGDDDSSEGGFKGTVIGFGSEDVPVPGVKVIALDNDTGEPITGFETVAEADGTVTFNGLPGERIGFKVFAKEEGGKNVYIDTYQFNIRTDAQDETVWSVPMTVFLAGPAAAKLTVDPTKAIAGGGAYWLDADGNEFPIECATLEVEGGLGDVRYFNDSGFPSPIDKNPSVNKANGYWIAANLPPGKVTFHAKVGDEIVGSTTFHAYAGEAITIGNIEADEKYTSNPGKCE